MRQFRIEITAWIHVGVHCASLPGLFGIHLSTEEHPFRNVTLLDTLDWIILKDLRVFVEFSVISTLGNREKVKNVHIFGDFNA